MDRVAKRAPIQPVDPRHPQPRHIQRAKTVLQDGGIVSYPTDTYYALGCDAFQKKAMERLALLKRRDGKKPFAFLCADLGEVAKYAIVSNESFRLMRRLLPGPYTIVLDATRLVPRTALTRQRQVGVRVPDAPVATALVRALGHPLATTSAALRSGAADRRGGHPGTSRARHRPDPRRRRHPQRAVHRARSDRSRSRRAARRQGPA